MASAERDSRPEQYVVVRIADEEYGLPIGSVTSIVRFEEPTPVPHAGAGIMGVLNLRGQVLPVVDLADVLLGRELARSGRARVVVCDDGRGPVGLAVDDAHEVIAVDADACRPAPPVLATGGPAQAVTAVASLGERLVLLLDPARVLAGLGMVTERDEESSPDA